MSKLPRHPKDRGYGFLKACEYPETQSGFASFSMHELAELITKPIKHDKRTTKHVPAKRTASKN